MLVGGDGSRYCEGLKSRKLPLCNILPEGNESNTRKSDIIEGGMN